MKVLKLDCIKRCTKTSRNFGGCFGIAFYTEFQGILSYTFKVEAALTEELSPEENFFFP